MWNEREKLTESPEILASQRVCDKRAQWQGCAKQLVVSVAQPEHSALGSGLAPGPQKAPTCRLCRLSGGKGQGVLGSQYLQAFSQRSTQRDVS